MKIDLLRRNRMAKRALISAILSITCISASAASFDCAKARSTSERLICGDPQLSALDERLAALAAAGKKRAASPRAFQRALDAAWLLRQQCDNIACVESWYAQRITALSHGQSKPDSLEERPAPKAGTPVAAPAPAAEKRVPEPAPKPMAGAAASNVDPGAQLLVIGQELGFTIPLTREAFLERYDASGGRCGASQQLSSLKVLSRSAQSDCWTGSECRAPAPILSCKSLRTAYDGTGRIVLFTTTLSTVDANRAEGARALGEVANKFAELGGGEPRTKALGNGRVRHSIGTQGQFRLEAEVIADEAGQQVGTFSVATK